MMRTPETTVPQLPPPDLARCQAEKLVSAFTFGPEAGKRVRCANRPVVVITEKEPGADGLRGSMSLCDECLRIATAKGLAFTLKPIAPVRS